MTTLTAHEPLSSETNADASRYEPIERVRADAERYLREQAERGAVLVGSVYGFAPPELIRACGAVPVRLSRSGGFEAQQRGEQLIASTCTYCKALVGSADDFPQAALSLLVGDGLCEALRRAVEVWAERLERPVHAMSVPRVGGPGALGHYLDELRELAGVVCGLTGQSLDHGRLRAELAAGNRARALLREINDHRCFEPPRLRASELWTLTAAAAQLPPERALAALGGVLHELPQRPPLGAAKGKRLLWFGSLLAQDDRACVELVEGAGGHIASDALGEGQGAFWHDFALDDDPWRALAHGALERSWHVSRPHGSLLEHVRAEIERARIDGVLYKTLEFCDPWTLQAKRFKADLGVPFVHIDGDYAPSHTEQLRTRIEAFLEML